VRYSELEILNVYFVYVLNLDEFDRSGNVILKQEWGIIPLTISPFASIDIISIKLRRNSSPVFRLEYNPPTASGLRPLPIH